MSQYRQSPFANLTPVVKNLLIINVIFFLATYLLGSVGINLEVLLSGHYFNSQLFRPWQIITYMFMHAGFWHIFVNMFVLFMFGPTLEDTLGSKRFINFYFITGIGALFIQNLVQAIEVHQLVGSFVIPNGYVDAYQGYDIYSKLSGIYGGSIVGASGAIFGVVVGFAMLYPNVELLIYGIIPVKAKYAAIGYILLELFSGINPSQGDSVAHFAHLGGALFGFIMIRIWGLHRRDNYYN
jgi:membrane associated rhomboid family serine protease